MAERGRRGKLLIVLHQAHSTSGRVGRVLQSLGFDLDVRRPPLGEPLPPRLDRHAGVVVFGGPMSANDGDEWIRREIDWLSVPLEENKPFLGLCLGAQMLARQLGARVYSLPDRQIEAGYYPLAPTPAADRLCAAPFPRFAYQWHSDGFELPVGAELLADGVGDFPHQAFIHGRRAVGLQFHPEVTYQMMCRWTTRGEERLSCPGARSAHEHREGWFQHDGAVSTWLVEFLEAWAGDELSIGGEEWPTPARSRAEAGGGLPLESAAVGWLRSLRLERRATAGAARGMVSVCLNHSADSARVAAMQARP